MSLLQTFLAILGLDSAPNHPLAPDAPDDVVALRQYCIELNREWRALKVERDCLKAELLRATAPNGNGPLFTEKSLALRVRMYDRALRARVKAMRA